MNVDIQWVLGILITVETSILGGLAMWLAKIDSRVFGMTSNMVTRGELAAAVLEVKASVVDLGKKIDRMMETKEDK